METISHGAHQTFQIQTTAKEIQVSMVWNRTGRVSKRWGYRSFGKEVRTTGRAPWIAPGCALDARLNTLKKQLMEGVMA